MRMGWALAAIVVATTACGSSSADSSPPASVLIPSRCGPANGVNAAINRMARIYTVGHKVYGCANHRRSRIILLGVYLGRPGQPQVGQLALAGVDVAYAETTSGVDTASAQVVVRRLDDGRTVRRLAAISQPLGPESFQSVDSIVVKADGAVAWIGVARSIIRHTSQVEVDRADQSGRSRLDAGSGIGSTSLRLHRSSLSWRDGGAERTATLR